MKIKIKDKKLILKLIIPLLIISVTTVQLILLINTMQLIKKTQDHMVESIPTVAEKPLISSDALYCLYECGGKIGIYDAQSNVLIDIIDVFASSLPSADRKALDSGIEIHSFSELAKIIEDFTS